MIYGHSHDDGDRVSGPPIVHLGYREVQGDLVKNALEGKFDVITHGCNCFCTMGKGIAVDFRRVFGADQFRLENPLYKGDFNKLGQIDFETYSLKDGNVTVPGLFDKVMLTVVNSYTQYKYATSPGQVMLDEEALTLCLRKINKEFSGMRIGLPRIGCGLAGGNWTIVSKIVKKELCDCDVTVMYI